MKRSAIKRRTPLRRTAIRRVRYVDPIPVAVAAEVERRSGGVCERCRQARATQKHHRQKRSQGGQHTASNLAHLRLGCHDWCEAHPQQAAAEGWSIQRNKVRAGVA